MLIPYMAIIAFPFRVIHRIPANIAPLDMGNMPTVEHIKDTVNEPGSVDIASFTIRLDGFAPLGGTFGNLSAELGLCLAGEQERFFGFGAGLHPILAFACATNSSSSISTMPANSLNPLSKNLFASRWSKF